LSLTLRGSWSGVIFGWHSFFSLLGWAMLEMEIRLRVRWVLKDDMFIGDVYKCGLHWYIYMPTWVQVRCLGRLNWQIACLNPTRGSYVPLWVGFKSLDFPFKSAQILLGQPWVGLPNYHPEMKSEAASCTSGIVPTLAFSFIFAFFLLLNNTVCKSLLLTPHCLFQRDQYKAQNLGRDSRTTVYGIDH
jgi:hypothetical protein